MRLLFALAVSMLWLSGLARAQTPKLVTEEFKVPHTDGIDIYVRSERPDGVQRFGPDRVAILMHGATYPSDSFDLALGGKSWMEYLAERGFSEGTHGIALEKHRMLLFRTVQQFLEEPPPAADARF